MVGKGILKRKVTDFRIGETVEYRGMTEEDLQYLKDFNGLLHRKIHKQPLEETVGQYGHVIKDQNDYDALYSYIALRRKNERDLMGKGKPVKVDTTRIDYFDTEIVRPEGGFIDMIDHRDRAIALRPYGDLEAGLPDGTKVRVAIPNHYLESATGEIVGYRDKDRMYEVKVIHRKRTYNCIFFRYELTLEESKVVGCPAFYEGENIR